MVYYALLLGISRRKHHEIPPLFTIMHCNTGSPARVEVYVNSRDTKRVELTIRGAIPQQATEAKPQQEKCWVLQSTVTRTWSPPPGIAVRRHLKSSLRSEVSVTERFVAPVGDWGIAPWFRICPNHEFAQFIIIIMSTRLSRLRKPRSTKAPG
jgi:hypothetical protein